MSQALNQKAAAWLHAYRTGALPPDKLAFGTALRQIALDDSPESLDRITALLDQIRAKVRPVFHEFAREQGCLNFAQLLGFYLGSAIAREAGTTLDWRDYAEALPLLPAGTPRKFANLVVGVGNGGRTLCQPLRVIRDRLFGDQPGPGCREYVEQTARQFREQAPRPTETAPAPGADEAEELIPIRRADAVAPPAAARGMLGKLGLGGRRGGRNPYWFETVTQAGYLAASGMHAIADGTALNPTLLRPARGRGRRGLEPVELRQDSAEAAIESGQQALLENPQNSDYLLLLHEGLVHLPAGPAAALRLECRSYRGEELHLLLALPYRPARQPGGFAIFSPRLMVCSAPPQLRPELFGAFYAGVDRFDAPGRSWDRYLDERL